MRLGPSPFPVPKIQTDELKRNGFKKDHSPDKGLWELRHVIAEHHSRAFGIDGIEDDVLIAPISKELEDSSWLYYPHPSLHIHHSPLYF
jgi:hypothetical protein